MILYMTWFSERGRELAARIAELSLSVSYGFWQSRYGGHPAVSKIQIRERGNRSLPDFLEEAFAQQFPVIFHWSSRDCRTGHRTFDPPQNRGQSGTGAG